MPGRRKARNRQGCTGTLQKCKGPGLMFCAKGMTGVIAGIKAFPGIEAKASPTPNAAPVGEASASMLLILRRPTAISEQVQLPTHQRAEVVIDEGQNRVCHWLQLACQVVVVIDG